MIVGSIYSSPNQSLINGFTMVSTIKAVVDAVIIRIVNNSQYTSRIFSLLPSAIRFPTPAPVLFRKFSTKELNFEVMIV